MALIYSVLFTNIIKIEMSDSVLPQTGNPISPNPIIIWDSNNNLLYKLTGRSVRALLPKVAKFCLY